MWLFNYITAGIRCDEKKKDYTTYYIYLCRHM